MPCLLPNNPTSTRWFLWRLRVRARFPCLVADSRGGLAHYALRLLGRDPTADLALHLPRNHWRSTCPTCTRGCLQRSLRLQLCNRFERRRGTLRRGRYALFTLRWRCSTHTRSPSRASTMAVRLALLMAASPHCWLLSGGMSVWEVFSECFPICLTQFLFAHRGDPQVVRGPSPTTGSAVPCPSRQQQSS